MTLDSLIEALADLIKEEYVDLLSDNIDWLKTGKTISADGILSLQIVEHYKVSVESFYYFYLLR